MAVPSSATSCGDALANLKAWLMVAVPGATPVTVTGTALLTSPPAGARLIVNGAGTVATPVASLDGVMVGTPNWRLVRVRL